LTLPNDIREHIDQDIFDILLLDAGKTRPMVSEALDKDAMRYKFGSHVLIYANMVSFEDELAVSTS